MASVENKNVEVALKCEIDHVLTQSARLRNALYSLEYSCYFPTKNTPARGKTVYTIYSVGDAGTPNYDRHIKSSKKRKNALRRELTLLSKIYDFLHDAFKAILVNKKIHILPNETVDDLIDRFNAGRQA